MKRFLLKEKRKIPSKWCGVFILQDKYVRKLNEYNVIRSDVLFSFHSLFYIEVYYTVVTIVWNR